MPLIDSILAYKNVNLRNIDLIKYCENTPAEEWIKKGIVYDSKYLTAHVSDLLRLIR